MIQAQKNKKTLGNIL